MTCSRSTATPTAPACCSTRPASRRSTTPRTARSSTGTAGAAPAATSSPVAGPSLAAAPRWSRRSEIAGAPGLGLAPALLEEPGDERGGLLGAHAPDDLDLVVQPWIGAQVVERATGPGLGVGRP